MTSSCFPKRFFFFNFRVKVRVKVEVEVRVRFRGNSLNTFSVKRLFG